MRRDADVERMRKEYEAALEEQGRALEEVQRSMVDIQAKAAERDKDRERERFKDREALRRLEADLKEEQGLTSRRETKEAAIRRQEEEMRRREDEVRAREMKRKEDEWAKDRADWKERKRALKEEREKHREERDKWRRDREAMEGEARELRRQLADADASRERDEKTLEELIASIESIKEENERLREHEQERDDEEVEAAVRGGVELPADFGRSLEESIAMQQRALRADRYRERGGQEEEEEGDGEADGQGDEGQEEAEAEELGEEEDDPVVLEVTKELEEMKERRRGEQRVGGVEGGRTPPFPSPVSSSGSASLEPTSPPLPSVGLQTPPRSGGPSGQRAAVAGGSARKEVGGSAEKRRSAVVSTPKKDTGRPLFR